MLAPFLLKQKIPVLIGISNFLVAFCNFTVTYFFPMWFQIVMVSSASIAGECNSMICFLFFFNIAFRLAPPAERHFYDNRIHVCRVQNFFHGVYLSLTPSSQMVDAQNGEVQIHQPDIRDPPLHRNDVGSNYERELEPRETLVEYRTNNQPSTSLCRF
jgi:hypothetical protein